MAVVGSAEIVVTALTTGIKKQIRDSLKDSLSDIKTQGKKAGDGYATEFRKEARKGIGPKLTEMFRGTIGPARTAGRDAGEAYAKAMVRSITKSAKDIGDALAKEIDTSMDKSADKAAKNLSKKMKEKAQIEAEIELNKVDEAIEKAWADATERIRKSARRVGILLDPDFEIDRNNLDSLDDLRDRIQQGLRDKLGDDKVTIPVGVSILDPDFDRWIKHIEDQHKQTQAKMREDKEKTDKAFQRSPFGRLSAAIDRLRSKVRQMSASWENARKAFLIMYSAGAFLASGLVALIGAAAALGSTIGVMAVAVGQAASSLIVLPSLLIAAAQAAITLKAAFAGVGEALKGGFKAAGDESDAATGRTVDNSNRIRDARERLADAYADAAYRQAQAEQRVIDAEADLVDSIRELERAQSQLNDAYERGREELEDLAFAAEDAAIAEEEAALRLEDAVLELQKVQHLPPDSRARREAELSYQRAELAYRQAKDRNEDLAKAQEEAAEAGVEGTDAVISAKEEIAQAEQDVLDKQKALADARADELRQAQLSARAVRDARQALADALNDSAKGAANAKSETDKFLESLEKLPIAAQKFVIEFLKLRPALEELRENAAEGFFSEINDSVGELEKLFDELNPVMFSTAQTLGKVADEAINLVTSADYLERLTDVAGTNRRSIEDLGGALVDVIDGFTSVLVAADPLIGRFTGWIAEISEEFREFANSAEGQERIAAVFERSGDVAARLGEIMGNLVGVMKNYAETAGPAVDYLLVQLEESTRLWEAQGKLSGEALAEQQRGTVQAVKNTKEFGGLLGDILRLLQEMGRQPELEETFRILREAVVPLREMALAGNDAGPAFARLIVSLAELLAAFAESDALIIFFDTLTLITDALVDFARSDIGQQIITTLAPMLAIMKGISLALLPLQFLFKAFAGSVQYVLIPLGNLFKTFTGGQTVLGGFQNILAKSGGGMKGFLSIVKGVGLGVSKFSVILTAVIVYFTSLWKALQKNDRLDRLKDLFERLASLFTGTVVPALGDLFDAFNFVFDIVTEIMSWILGVAIDGFINFWDIILGGVEIVKDLAEKLGFLKGPLSSVIGWFKGSETSVESFSEQFEDMDAKLAGMVQSGQIGKASNEFGVFQREMEKAGLSTEEITEALPAYAKALKNVEDEQQQQIDALRVSTEEWKGLESAMDKVFKKLDELRGEYQSVGEAEDRLAESRERTAEAIAAATGALLEQNEAGRAARESIRDQADSLFDWLEAQERAGGAAFDFAGEYEKAYKEMADQISEQTGLAGEALEEYLEKLGYIPPEKVTELEIDKDSAVQEINAYILGELDSVPDDITTLAEWTDDDARAAVIAFEKHVQDEYPEFAITTAQLDDLVALGDISAIREELLGIERTYVANVRIATTTTGGGIPPHLAAQWATGEAAEGGPIYGPGGPKDDKAGLWALSNGEFVLSAAAVQNMGGMKVVDDFHRQMKQTRSSSLGATGVKTDTSFNPYNPDVMSVGEQAIVEELRALRNQDVTQSGMAINIGSISTASPEATTSEIITSMRAERWRMGAGL